MVLKRQFQWLGGINYQGATTGIHTDRLMPGGGQTRIPPPVGWGLLVADVKRGGRDLLPGLPCRRLSRRRCHQSLGGIRGFACCRRRLHFLVKLKQHHQKYPPAYQDPNRNAKHFPHPCSSFSGQNAHASALFLGGAAASRNGGTTSSLVTCRKWSEIGRHEFYITVGFFYQTYHREVLAMPDYTSRLLPAATHNPRHLLHGAAAGHDDRVRQV